MSQRALKHFRFGKLFAWLRRNTSSRKKQIHQVRELYLSLGLQSCGCKICSGNSFTLLAESDRYGFDLKKQICNSCGLVQTYPTLSDEFLNQFYATLYRPLYTKSVGPVNYSDLVLEQKEKAVKLVNYLNQNLNDRLSDFHLVEIGCSSGGILAGASQYFSSVQGCDLDVSGTEYARTVLGLQVETSALPTLLPKGRKIFLMSHVLEHLNHPLQTLIKVREYMERDDLLVVIVPGLNAVKTGDYKYDLRRYFHIAHITDFTAGTLNHLALKAGLENIQIDERIYGLFRLSDKSSMNTNLNSNDTVANVLAVEKIYQTKKLYF